jgi:hypothetical protein
MALGRQVDSNEKIIRKQRRDAFVFSAGSGKLQARKKAFYSLQAEMKLNLLLFAWLAVQDVPVALCVNHRSVPFCAMRMPVTHLKEFVSNVNK